MEEKRKLVIIKQVKKGHGGAHGGSWKVAYADFVTAMMAFFLLMWLLNMSSQEKRAVMALYFKNFSLFQQGGQSFMMAGGTNAAMQHAGGQEVVEAGEQGGGITSQESTAKIISGIGEKTQSSKDQVIIGVTNDGIRIQIVDTPENPIFPPGSADMTEAGKKIIRSVVSIIKYFPNEIVIEGHTDSSPTKSEQVSNWELSTTRASAARREFEADGIEPARIAMVAGFADKAPLIKERPDDPRNRRISLLFLKGKSAKPPDRFEWLKKPAPPKQSASSQ